jgi:hypothetical protein
MWVVLQTFHAAWFFKLAHNHRPKLLIAIYIPPSLSLSNSWISQAVATLPCKFKLNYILHDSGKISGAHKVLQKKKPTFMQLLTANGWFSGLLY